MTGASLHLVHTTGAANPLAEGNGNRRFWAQPISAHSPLLEFRIKAPGHKPYEGLFANAQQARQHAEHTFPGTFPASVVCTSRKRMEARQ